MGFRYTGIRIRDLPKAIGFYTRVLGKEVTWRMKIRETGGEIAVLKSPRGTQRLELNWYPKGSRFYTPFRKGEELDHLAFTVPDVRRFLRRHKAEFKVLIPPFKEGKDWLAYVLDRDGVCLELMSPQRLSRAKT